MAAMDRTEVRARVAALAHKHLERGDPVGWFEALYQSADGDQSQIPWAEMEANPYLARWLADNPHLAGHALVVGCGLGDDAEAMASAGWRVTAFDVSASSVAWCKKRFPDSKVGYEVADLLEAPEDWARKFDLVVEVFTVQALPLDVRFDALDALQSFIPHGGRLLLIARGRDDDDEAVGPPWAVSHAELEQLLINRMSLDRFEDFYDHEDPPKRRFVGVYRKPPSLLAD
jgi:SAM-dependent methyltransferase